MCALDRFDDGIGGAPYETNHGLENWKQQSGAGEAGDQPNGETSENIRRIVNADQHPRERNQRRPDQEQNASAAGHEQNAECNREGRSGVIARERRIMRG